MPAPPPPPPPVSHSLPTFPSQPVSQTESEQLVGEDESEESDYFQDESDDQISINENIEVAASPPLKQILDIKEISR